MSLRDRPSDNAEMEDEGGAGFDIARAFSAVRRRWWWIAVAVIFCACAGAGVVSLMPKKYLATAVVQLEPRRNSVANLEGFAADFHGDNAAIESEVEIVHSRVIAKRVIDVLRLRDDPEFTNPESVISNAFGLLGGFWPSWGDVGDTAPERLGLNGDQGAVARGVSAAGAEATDFAGDAPWAGNDDLNGDFIADVFSSRLSSWRVRKTFLISIGFWSNDPVKAARIANTVAEVYLSEQLHAKRGATRVASQLLEKKIDALRLKVDEAERKVEQYKVDYGLLTAEGHVLSEKELARLMEQTVIARQHAAEARSRFENARNIQENGGAVDALSEVLQSRSVLVMKEKLANAQRRQAELSIRYGARHPEMQKVQAEVRDARTQLRAEIDREVRALESAYSQAALREKELLDDLNRSKSRQASATQNSTVLGQLERDAKTSRRLLEILLERYKQATETEDLQLPDARIVEVAEAPLGPSSPKGMKIIAIAAAGGFALSLLLVLGLEFATSGLGRPEDVEDLLSITHLTSLPQIGTDGGDGAHPYFETRHLIADPVGGFAEAIRNVRRELDILANGPGSRVILVAGSVPGDGSSGVASNVAHHYALTGHNVLLVDGDIRRGLLSRELAPQREIGLMDVLARNIPVDHAILTDRMTNLNFLPCAGAWPSTVLRPEYLSMPAMGHCVEQLRHRFDVVVIDSPPLLPVIDGRVLADYADQIVFVMGWRSTPKALAKKALKLLSVNEHKIAGVVVNKVGREMLDRATGADIAPQPQSDAQYAA